MDPQRLDGDVEVVFAVERLDLVEGTYKLDVAVHTRDGYPYDYHRLLYTFRVKSRTPDVGIYRPPHHWTFSRGRASSRPDAESPRRCAVDRQAAGRPLSRAARESSAGAEDSRVHQRRVRSSAPRPRALPRARPRASATRSSSASTRIDRSGPTRGRAPDHARGRAGRDPCGAGVPWMPS